MARHRILRNVVSDEVRRTILREALTRYRSELLDMDEREILWNRIVRLRRQIGLA